MSEVSTKAPDPMDIALGAAVRIRRRTIGMSQEALADQCGVSFQQIQKYENGANRISFSRLVQISRALRCRVTDLMDVFDGADKETAEDLDLLRSVFLGGRQRPAMTFRGRSFEDLVQMDRGHRAPQPAASAWSMTARTSAPDQSASPATRPTSIPSLP